MLSLYERRQDLMGRHWMDESCNGCPVYAVVAGLRASTSGVPDGVGEPMFADIETHLCEAYDADEGNSVGVEQYMDDMSIYGQAFIHGFMSAFDGTYDQAACEISADVAGNADFEAARSRWSDRVPASVCSLVSGIVSHAMGSLPDEDWGNGTVRRLSEGAFQGISDALGHIAEGSIEVETEIGLNDDAVISAATEIFADAWERGFPELAAMVRGKAGRLGGRNGAKLSKRAKRMKRAMKRVSSELFVTSCLDAAEDASMDLKEEDFDERMSAVMVAMPIGWFFGIRDRLAEEWDSEERNAPLADDEAAAIDDMGLGDAYRY